MSRHALMMAGVSLHTLWGFAAMSPAVQNAYATSIPVGFPGMIAIGEGGDNIISRVLESSAGIGFGQPAFQGTNARGCVIGATFAATGTGSAAAGNVGTSTITASPTISAGAQAGRYTAVQLATSSTGAFVVTDPGGVVVGHGAVGSAFTGGGLAFTITAAGTPTIGDTFYVDVTYTANGDFLGLTVKDTTVPPNTANPDLMPQYWNIPIMVRGVIWVTAGASVTVGGDVYWNPATSRFTSTTTHIRIPRARFDSAGANGDVVKVAIRH